MSKSLILLAAVLFPAAAFADDVNVIVGFHGKSDSGIFARHGGVAETDLSALQACAGHVPPGKIKSMRAEPGVAYVEEDLVREASDAVVPNDKYYTQYQAGSFGLIRAPEAWGVSTGAGVRVAVLDTGCLTSHTDISGKVKITKNFTTKKASTDVTDNDGHGTHTAGTVGAKTNNGTGVAAAGFNCELAIGKVLGPAGGYDSWIAAGIDWARQTAGAKVVSMSLGGPGAGTTLEDAVNAAWNGGLVVVAAASNDASSAPSYPAAYENCISVAAVDNAGALASWSNYGPTVDIAAPGVSILSTYKKNGYAFLSGTSMATPHVAGVAALVWASPFGTSPAAVRAQIERCAKLNVTGANAGTLHVLDAAAAVTVAAP